MLVFKNVVGNESFLEVGTKLNANVTHELILTIFHPNTPLHDGATVISNDQIVAAGVLLPLTEDPTLSWKYGTRHRAAIGMSEVEARGFLTEFSVTQAENSTIEWKKLGEYLWVKYMDGNIKKEKDG